MDKQEKEKLREEYENAPIIPVTISNYIKILLMVYREKILRPKYFLILALLAIPIFVITISFLPINDALYLGGGLFIFLLFCLPLLFTCLMFLLQKSNIVQPYRRFGQFKEIN